MWRLTLRNSISQPRQRDLNDRPFDRELLGIRTLLRVYPDLAVADPIMG
jgi:hypothetical protein